MNPITRKRLRRFREMKRAHYAFWILVILYGVSLCSELICNSVPLYVRFQGDSYFPVFKFYPEDTFTGSGHMTRPDYRVIETQPVFAEADGNFMIWPPVSHGPYEVTDLSTLEARGRVAVRVVPEPRVGSIRVNRDLEIVRALSAATFFGVADDSALDGVSLADTWRLPADLRQAIEARFQNKPADSVAVEIARRDGTQGAEVTMPTYRERSSPPKPVKLTLRDREQAADRREFVFDENHELVSGKQSDWTALPEEVREAIDAGIEASLTQSVEPIRFERDGVTYTATLDRERVRFPFRPCRGHWFGIDNAGRDVFSRILYGLRTSMTFGLILVVCSLCIGTVVGSLQGYFGGVLDLAGQRVIEVWSALPFLYVMILMGSIYGPSFQLLIFCYGLFNWIGMSYYMRAEMLRLRKQPFVEAARCLGLPSWKIIFRHVLPNGLVPLITLFPFSLVGAIGSLAALDYLGFGLPPPTPSWGELLAQAQSLRWAWWLILYPSLALFLVMLLGVFVGEGVRNAFDPRRFSKLQ
jgi:microcin C transport system permease protein